MTWTEAIVPNTSTRAAALAGLFEPMEINGCRVGNRIVMAPMTRNFAPEGVLDPRAAAYYRRRVEGGAGLILTEGCAISPISAWTRNIPSLFGADALAAWKPVVSGVHSAGGRIMAQLWHAGLGRVLPAAYDPSAPSLGPSVPYPESPTTMADPSSFRGGEAMTASDIAATIADYVAAGRAAQELGFDGVELHAAHGYLIDEFLWRGSNRRDDAYNGGPGERARFAGEIVAALRDALGSSYPIGLRFSQWKLPDNYSVRAWTDPAALTAFLKRLVAAGVDFFDCSTRRFWEPAFEDGDRTLAGWTKAITGRPVIAVGSVGLENALQTSAERIGDISHPASIDRMLDHFACGEFDMIAIGRAMLANPDWANLVRAGQLDQLRPYDVSALQTLD